MKRFLGILCATALLLGLAACGGESSPSPAPQENSLPAASGESSSSPAPQDNSLPIAIAHPPCRGDGQCGSLDVSG